MNKPANPTCATCRHECVRGLPFLPFIKSQFCGHPLALDRVTGRADTPCALMRGSPAGRGDPKALCGAQGRNWEAREVTPRPLVSARHRPDGMIEVTTENPPGVVQSRRLVGPLGTHGAALGVTLRNATDEAAKEYAGYVGELARQQAAAGDQARREDAPVDPVTAIVQRLKPR